MTRDEIIAQNPIEVFLPQHGVEITLRGKAPKCVCPFHDDHDPSMSISIEKQTWYCHVCQVGGSIIDFVMRRNNIGATDAMELIAGKNGNGGKGPGDRMQRPQPTAKAKYREVEEYEYTDEHGRPVYYIKRMETPDGAKKKFAQFRSNNGKREPGMDGVRRVLYRLPRVLAATDDVFLVEGEKCVHALEYAGFVATTNSGGSGAWVDSYAEDLRDKHVVVMPDNDAPGEKWRDKVIASLEGKAGSVRVVPVPDPHNDIADMLDGLEEPAQATIDLIGAHPRVIRGVDIPVMSASEIVSRYRAEAQRNIDHPITLCNWLPSLRGIRSFGPGDVITFLGDTGVGKTAIIQNVAMALAPNTTLIFELELTAELLGERFIQIEHKIMGSQAEHLAATNQPITTEAWGHIHVCPESHMDIEKMESIINRAELKIGSRPRVVMVDYIGLLSSKGASRYERVSAVAEGLKVIAKATQTVMIVVSQVSRKGGDAGMRIGLHDAKDSGSIENSSALVVGCYRPNRDSIILEVLKGTRDGTGMEVECDYDGSTFQISEHATIAQAFDPDEDITL